MWFAVFTLAATLAAHATSAEQWSTLDQAELENPSAVSVSPDGNWAVFAIASVAGKIGNLSAAGGLELVWLPSVQRQTLSFCSDGGCSLPSFASDGSLAFLRDGVLYRTRHTGAPDAKWGTPVAQSTAGTNHSGPILAYALAPNSKSFAYTVAEMGTFSDTEPRVITTDVIVDVIVGAAQPTRNILCVAPFGTGAASTTHSPSARCFDALAGSVGMEGWRISCYPFDSQVSWSSDSRSLAATITDGRLANNWESVRLVILDLDAGRDSDASAPDTHTSRNRKPKLELEPIALAFQPAFSADGRWLAFTQADTQPDAAHPDAYTWAQTWRICIMAMASGTIHCDQQGTADAMPTMVGWVRNSIVYMEQNKTEVSLYTMATTMTTAASTAANATLPHAVGAAKALVPTGWSRVLGMPCSSDGDCGVIGGGFRATSRATITCTAACSTSSPRYRLGFSWESLRTAPQAFVAALELREVAVVATDITQISDLNAAAAQMQWPAVTTHSWESDDGMPVQGLLIHASSPSHAAATGVRPSSGSPLIVFTHCGPAMASLGTFIGAGSVCARFPLAIWAQRGYNVLLPNYRGSTGYGRAFRRANLNGWGAGDYADVMTGIQSLALTGAASIDNVAHVGWSYGGYTSALALTKAKTTHGIKLKCVVGGGSLTDLISQVGTTDISRIYQSSNSLKYYWDDEGVQRNFMERSAMYHVANASAPTLLFHGQRDPRMPISQSFQLHYALQARKVPSRFLVFPGSGHIPSDPNQIVRVWDESLAWVATHMPVQ